MNNNLYLKHHGLPGIGIIGPDGESGKDGNSIYFGFVKDFFDGTPIKHDARVKLAKRNASIYSDPSDPNGQTKYIELMSDLWSKITNSSNFYDTSLSENFMNYIYLNSNLYYSGMVYDNKTSNIFSDNALVNELLQYKFDIDTMPWLMALMMSNIDDASIISNTESFAEINIANIRIQNGGVMFNYVDTYSYVEDEVTGEYISSVNTTIDRLHITFEPEDAAEYLGKKDKILNEKYDDPAIYTLLDKDAEPVALPINPGDYSYLKENINDTNPVLTTDTNDFFARIKLNDNANMTYYDYNNAYYLSPNDVSKYVKNAILLQDSIIFDDEFVINDNGHKLTYYGIDASLWLSKSSDEIHTTIVDAVANTSLYNTYNDIDKAIDKYVDRITMTLSNNPLIGDDADKLTIRWIADEDNIITIPSNLSSKYKAGDIIYFYTDEQDYMTSNKISNMVIITDELEGCGIDEFLASSIKTNPFEIKYFNDINSRVTCTNKIITLSQNKSLQNKDVRDINRFSYNSINNIIGSYNDSAIILADGNNATTSNYILIKAINDENSPALSINANNLQGYISMNKSRFDSMLVPNKSFTSNVESYRAVYDPYIILDDNKFITPIKEDDLYEYLVDNNVYIGTTLKASNYINLKYGNLLNYVYGYELYNSVGCLVLSEATSEQELQIFINNISPNNDMYNNNVTTYSVVEEFILSHLNLSNNLDWDGLTFKYINFTLIDKFIYFVFDSGIHPSDSPYNEINTIKILMSADNCKYYTYASEYLDGLYYYHESGKTIKSLDAVYQNDVTISTDKDVVTKNVDPYHSWFYIHTFVANKFGGVKYNSKVSVIDYLLSVTNNYLTNYTCSVIGDGDDLIVKPQDGNIEFKTSSITPEQNQNGSLIIQPSNNDVSILNVYINHKLVNEAGSLYKNSWFNTVLTSKNDGSYQFVFNTESNMPSLYDDIDAISDDPMSINEYMTSLCDIYDSLSSVPVDDEAQLFKALASDKKLPSTNDRYVLISVEYVSADSSTTTQIENYNILQPGFKDTRDIPNVSINIHTDMESVEKYNTTENGVLCNQFVTYMDINIDNFDDMWSKFLDNSTNISMDLEFININSDLDWTSKYTVLNATTTRNTIKIIPNDEYNTYNKCFSNKTINNYVALNTKFVSPEDNSDISYDYATISNQLKIQLDKSIAYEQDCNSFVDINDKQYILCTSTIMGATSKPEYIYRGINNYIDIKLEGLTPLMVLDNSTYRLKIEYEMGNPMVSALYLRIALKKVVIHYDTYIKDSSGIMQPCNKTFTANVPKIKTPGIYNYIYNYSNSNIEEYKYISNTLNVVVNPISYILCPTDKETDITDMQGAVMKTGSDLKIGKKLCFYSNNIYDIEGLMVLDSSVIRDNLYYDWSNSKIKAGYFLDNIKNINVSYVDFSLDSLDDQHSYLMGHVSSQLLSSADALDMVEGEKYINIVYNASIMNPKLRDGKYTFYYNGQDFNRDQYDQLKNNSPIYVSDEATIEIRTQELVDAMDAWNFEYINNSRNDKDKTFVGNINQFGNGYQYLSNDIDIDQYASEKIMSLYETKYANNEYVYNTSTFAPLSYVSEIETYEPNNDGFYRTFLYDIDYTYPYYMNSNKIQAYQIVSDFDYIIKYLILNGITVDEQYQNKIDQLVNKYGDDYPNLLMIPYSLLFDLSPRIAYNTDYDTINVLMLRKPSIGLDHDKATDVDDCYKLKKHFFELSNRQKILKLKNPYSVIG